MHAAQAAHRDRLQQQGLSLLEVVLALAILAGSFAILAQLVGIGLRAAGNARDLTQAQILAESMMSEISAGIVDPASISNQAIETNPGWYVSAYTQATSVQGLLQVQLVIERTIDFGRPARFELTRLIRDPSLAIPTDEETSSSSSSSSTRSSSTGSSTSTGGTATGGTATGGTSTGGGATGVATTGGSNNPSTNRTGSGGR